MGASSARGHPPPSPPIHRSSRPISATVPRDACLMGAPVLEVRELCAGYGAVRILTDVTLDVGRGEIVALLGSNGAGKTTLNNVLAGVGSPFAGSVLFDGEEISRA